MQDLFDMRQIKGVAKAADCLVVACQWSGQWWLKPGTMCSHANAGIFTFLLAICHILKIQMFVVVVYTLNLLGY